MADTWTIQRLLQWTTEYFQRKALDSPRLTSELLLSHALGCDRVRLYMDFDRPLNKDELSTFRSLVERRAEGEPTHYLLGRREFYGRPFRVDPRVLIPRPETELLVEAVLARLPSETSFPVLDLCAGSGCIAATLAAERTGLSVVAVEIDPGALEVARENVQALGVAERVELLQGDLFAPVSSRTFAAVVSNPPYVATAKIAGLMPEVQREPRSALDGGPDGLAIVRRIVREAGRHLAPGGWLALEIGEEQGPALLTLLTEAGLKEGRIERDLAGLDRVGLARGP